MQTNFEKNNTNSVIANSVLNMYKIPGFNEVSYEKYLKSRNNFEFDGVNMDEVQNSIASFKNKILGSTGEQTVLLLIETLNNPDIEIQRVGASLVSLAHEDKQQELKEVVFKKVSDALNNPDVQVQRIGMNMIKFVPEKDQSTLRNLTAKIIESGLVSGDVEVVKIMAKKINLVPENEQERLRALLYKNIVESLNKDDVIVQRLVSTLVQYVPTNKQDELKSLIASKFELAKKEGKNNQVIEPLLYFNASKNRNSPLSREPFSKTGSGTTLLLGENLKKNLIIRHIETHSFLAWKKAYESYDKWRAAGFDYVPVEPIYSFTNDKSNSLTNVASGVLDLNLEEWYAFSGGTFKADLEEQKNKITSTLEEIGVSHGHPNNANFCLRFYRNTDGIVDLEQRPRLYIIDFDKATSI